MEFFFMKNTFKIGDVVYLNSNPELTMTVDFVLGQKTLTEVEVNFAQQMKIAGYEEGDVNCIWFEGTELKEAPFKTKILSKK